MSVGQERTRVARVSNGGGKQQKERGGGVVVVVVVGIVVPGWDVGLSIDGKWAVSGGGSGRGLSRSDKRRVHRLTIERLK
jgi:hypothetical protein